MQGHSEITQVRQEISLQEKASERGLNGYAIVSTHDSIVARMANAASSLLELTKQGKHEEVVKILDTGNWC